MNIHKQAVQTLGARERLNHLRKEAIELAHEIDRYLDGKSHAELVVEEAHDVAYLTRSLEYIEEFEDFFNADYKRYLEFESESRLNEVLKVARAKAAAEKQKGA